MMERKHDKTYITGVISMLSCDVLWGFLPIYWQALRPIDSWVIIFYRIFLVGFVSGIATLKIYGLEPVKEQLRSKGSGIMNSALRFPLAGLLITANWSIYIWAVNADHVIQTCVGYYIEPLMVCVLGIIFFREKLTGFKLVAVLFALAGLVVLLVHFRQVPGIALGLALTFATYAALKKHFDLPEVHEQNYKSCKSEQKSNEFESCQLFTEEYDSYNAHHQRLDVIADACLYYMISVYRPDVNTPVSCNEESCQGKLQRAVQYPAAAWSELFFHRTYPVYLQSSYS